MPRLCEHLTLPTIGGRQGILQFREVGSRPIRTGRDKRLRVDLAIEDRLSKH